MPNRCTITRDSETGINCIIWKKLQKNIKNMRKEVDRLTS